MRSTLKRSVSASSVVLMAAGLLTVATLTAPTASAFAAGSLTITNQATGLSSGDNFAQFAFTTPAACDPTATRHVVKITNATATNAADQAAISGWVGRNFYSPVAVGLPGPFVAYPASNNTQGLANTFGLPLVPGDYEATFRCQNNLGTVIYEEFVGHYVFDSPTEWHAVVVDSRVASTTTLTANPATVTTGNATLLEATVTPLNTPAPTGNVEFYDGASLLGSGAVDATGKATLMHVFAASTSTVTAKYLGDTAYKDSVSAPVSVTVTAAPATATATTLSVTPTSGPANQSVTLTGTVAPAAAGTCTFKDRGVFLGSAPVNTTTGVCEITNSSFAGPGHEFTVAFASADTALFLDSASAMVPATYEALTYLPDNQTIIVTVPKGDLTIFTPYTPSNPLDLGALVLSADGKCYDASKPFDGVTVKDTRAGQLGWTASLTRAAFVNDSDPTQIIAADREGFINVAPRYIAGNALQSISVNDLPAGVATAASPMSFASAPAGASVGTVDITANFVLSCVPTSVTPGQYTSTVVFTIA